MPLLPLISSDIPLVWFEEPPKAQPEDVLVLDVVAPMPEPAPAAQPDAEPDPVLPEPLITTTAEPATVAMEPVATPEPAASVLAATSEPLAALPAAAAPEAIVSEAAPEPPVAAFEVPSEDAFPTAAELDAILAANAGPAAQPSAAERAAVIALLGLDPAIAEDPVLYARTLAELPEPDADQVLEQWMQEYGVVDPASLPNEPASDWPLA